MTTKCVLMVAAVFAALAVAATSVAAKPYEQFRFNDQTSEVVDGFCGDLQASIEFDSSGVIVGRLTRDGAPRYTLSNHGEGTITNLATGKGFTVTYNYTVQDVRVTVNDDGTLSILAQVPGPERWYGPDGQHLYTSGGMFRELVTIDYGGTLTDFSDDTFVSAEVVMNVGGRPQPEFDFCGLFHELTA